MNPYLATIAKNAILKQKVNKGDFVKNGLLYCHKCKTPKQCKATSDSEIVTLPCNCKCETDQYDKQIQAREKAQKEIYIRRLKKKGVQDKQVANWTFENDNGKNPKMTKLIKRYYDKWDKMYEQNIGLLLWGNVGTGKSYCASCIGNALLNDGVPVLMTNFSRIINDLSGFKEQDKNVYIDNFSKYKLIIIDDLGAERQSDYALEIVFNVIDNRYKNNQPVIITTNLQLDDIKKPSDIKYCRIYDRILEMCVPLIFKGESMRKTEYQKKIRNAKELLEDG